MWIICYFYLLFLFVSISVNITTIIFISQSKNNGIIIRSLSMRSIRISYFIFNIIISRYNTFNILSISTIRCYLHLISIFISITIFNTWISVIILLVCCVIVMTGATISYRCCRFPMFLSLILSTVIIGYTFLIIAGSSIYSLIIHTMINLLNLLS